MIVSWVTQDEPGSSVVLYWSENSKQKKEVKGKHLTYQFYNYTSGYIHHCTIRNLKVIYIVVPTLCPRMIFTENMLSFFTFS